MIEKVEGPGRAEVWLIEFEPSIGAEIRKIRPGVVMSHSNVGLLPLRIVVPITDWKLHYENLSWFHKLNPNRQNGLTKESAADCFQVKSLSVGRFVKRIGKVDQDEMEELVARISYCIK